MKTIVNIISTLLLAVMCNAQQLYLPMPIGNGAHTPYWTWNPTYMGTLGNLSNGNHTFHGTGGSNAVVIATLPGGTTGKSTGSGIDYYYEVTINTLGNNQSIGLENSLSANLNLHMGEDVHGYGYYTNGSNGGSWQAGTVCFYPSCPNPADAFNTGNVVGILFKSVGQIVMYRWDGTTRTLEATFTLPAGAYYPAMSTDGGTSTANFGASSWTIPGAPFGGSAWMN